MTYKRDDLLQTKTVILRSLRTVATPRETSIWYAKKKTYMTYKRDHVTPRQVRCDTQKTPIWYTKQKYIQEYLLCVHVCMCMCVCVCVCVRVCVYTLRFSMWHAKDTYMTYKWTSIWQSDIVSLTPYKSRLRYGNSVANTLHTSIWQSTYLYLTPYCLLLQCVAVPMYVSGTVSVGSIRLVSQTCRDERKTSEKVHTSRPTHV